MLCSLAVKDNDFRTSKLIDISIHAIIKYPAIIRKVTEQNLFKNYLLKSGILSL